VPFICAVEFCAAMMLAGDSRDAQPNRSGLAVDCALVPFPAEAFALAGCHAALLL